MAKKKLSKAELKLKVLGKALDWNHTCTDRIVKQIDDLREQLEYLVNDSAEIQHEIEEVEEMYWMDKLSRVDVPKEGDVVSYDDAWEKVVDLSP